MVIFLITMASHSPDSDDSVEDLSGDEMQQNLFGIQSEAPSVASSSSSSADDGQAGPEKKWSDHEIVSKLQSGDFKVFFKHFFYALCIVCVFLRYVSIPYVHDLRF